MRCPTLLALLSGVVLYLVMGALVFRTLEAPQESRAYTLLLETKNDFLKNHNCVSEQGFHELIKVMVTAVERGLDVSNGSTNFTSRWDLVSAFFFCGTIITTIGFGNLSPRTWFGQLFCVCYALVGIPMFGILLAGVGDHMGTILRRAVAKIETLFLKRKVSPTSVRVISAVLSILIGCLIFLAVPTVVFQEVEEWSFLEALYFVVITLTTVGFGDYVPGVGREGDVLFKPLVWLWIVFGLAYFASILTMISNWLRVLSKRTRAEVRDISQETVRNVHQAWGEEHLNLMTLLSSLLDSSPVLPSSSGCQLLDFFGENLAYIDESSDTLSDRFQPAASEEKRRRPRKPKRRSIRRQLPHGLSPLQTRKRLSSDMQPPSNPPTPPPPHSPL
uniref:Potassium two pore domain channel subfamily K member 4 n=1 Tax=Myripristis murdjan TaxID=586833 RepID=A0A667ZWD2_9TELE